MGAHQCTRASQGKLRSDGRVGDGSRTCNKTSGLNLKIGEKQVMYVCVCVCWFNIKKQKRKGDGGGRALVNEGNGNEGEEIRDA